LYFSRRVCDHERCAHGCEFFLKKEKQIEIAREAAKIADNERDGFAVFGVSLPHG
jgi:hypothetical protein